MSVNNRTNIIPSRHNARHKIKFDTDCCKLNQVFFAFGKWTSGKIKGFGL